MASSEAGPSAAAGTAATPVTRDAPGVAAESRPARLVPQSIALGGGSPVAEGSVSAAPARHHPEWIRARIPAGDSFQDVRRLLHGLSLHTVCEEAHCPNLGECWDQKTATVMILGDTCTRACGFCAVRTGKPTVHDLDEPRRVTEAIRGLGLDHVVVTSVTRDDLADGGASIFAETITRLREACPGMGVEVLVPDFNGEEAALRTVMRAGPDILNHNIETVARLQKPVRRRARYDRSLGVLSRAKEYAREYAAAGAPPVHTKSSMMVGLGETRDEMRGAFEDLRAVDCDILTIGQYLRPTARHLPVERYYHPDEFAQMREEALALGFRHVESGPLVRSSYHARDQVPDADAKRAARERCRDDDGQGAARPMEPVIETDGRVTYRPGR